MNTPTRQQIRVPLIYAIFFCSGFTALVYETIWSRMIGVANGQTAQAASIVLAAFFTGMAIGQYLGGRWSSRFSPLWGYGCAEIVASVWACLIPTLLEAVGTADAGTSLSLFTNSFAGRAAACFLILLPATVSIGATLPFIVEIFKERPAFRQGATVAYAINTGGGMVGVVAAAVVLIITAGVNGTGYLMALISGVCGLIACASSYAKAPAIAVLEHERIQDSKSMANKNRYWFILAGISGFATLGLEVLYIRLFALIFHNSIYTFTAVIAAFLLALMLSALFAAQLVKRISAEKLATAAFNISGVLLAVSIVAFPWLTGFKYFSFGNTFAAYVAGAFGLAAFFVVPPILMQGMIVPLAIEDLENSRAVGTMTAINTLAGAMGSIIAGLVLPELMGLWAACICFVSLLALTGAWLLLRHRALKSSSVFAIVSAGLIYLTFNNNSINRGLIEGEQLVQRWDSEYGWIDVVRSRTGDLAIRQNLHYRHGTTASRESQYRLGRIPLLLHPRPAKVAFLGIGTGLTAAPAVLDREVEQILLVELIPQVVSAARLLDQANQGVIDHPKTNIIIDDARHHLLREEQQHDVIVSDLFVPWECRTGYLYTVEFYQTVQRRLKDDGLFCQWLALYQVGPEEFELIADTFASVFPNTTIWWGRFDSKMPVVALVGSRQQLKLQLGELEKRVNSRPLQSVDTTLQRSTDLVNLFVGSWPHRPNQKLNTDEHPRLEFTAPISHRTGRTLAGKSLLKYFDEVFAHLSTHNVLLMNDASFDKKIHAIQKLSLFGDAE